MARIKGYEFNPLKVRDSFNRRAQQFANKIIKNLKLIGVPDDDVIIDLDPVAFKRAPASATWYLDGYRLHYSYAKELKYVENMFVVSKVIELEIKEVLEGRKDLKQFLLDFSEEEEVEQERKDARALIGVDEDSTDLEEINKKYKVLAKEAHPDMPGGDLEKFKALNRAHKILRRELE